MLRTTTLLLITMLMAPFSSGFGKEEAYKSDEIIVRFAAKNDGRQLTQYERNNLLASLNAGTIKHSYKRVPGLSVIQLPPNIMVEEAFRSLKNVNSILYAEPNYRIKPLGTFPDDTDFDEHWALHNTGQESGTADADIDAPQGWDIDTGSTSIIVAILDTGIDMDHPDLVRYKS